MKLLLAKPHVVLLIALSVLAAHSRRVSAQSQVDSAGVPANASTFPVEHGAINLANGTLHLEIPIVNCEFSARLRSMSVQA
jgi:hypothetical protein